MRTRTWMRAATVLVLGLFGATACGDITELKTDLTPELLSGDWEVTTAKITSVLNTNRSIDLLAEGGTIEFRFTIGGDATIFLTPPGGETEVSTGFYEIAPPYLLFYDTTDVDREDPDVLAYELQTTQTGNSLTLATTDIEWDFDGDGTLEPAFFAIVMIR